MSKAGSERWSDGAAFRRILEAMELAGIDRDNLTVEDLSPLDHFHARGFPATVELGDLMPVEAHHRLLDIGCGIGGPARYFAKRFGCHVTGIDITEDFVDAANRLSELVGLQDKVDIGLGDATRLAFDQASFDGVYAQHVTMNIEDRLGFFEGVSRIVKPGGYLALTEHGMGPTGDPYYPVPWSNDGTGSFLVTPDETVRLLQSLGFQEISVEETGARYLSGYQRAIALAKSGKLPAFGVHVLMGRSALEKTVNAARNIEEGRTYPIQVFCRKA